MADFVFKDSVSKKLDDHFKQMETERKKKFNASKNRTTTVGSTATSSSTVQASSSAPSQVSSQNMKSSLLFGRNGNWPRSKRG